MIRTLPLISFMVFLISGLVLIENIGITGAPISLSLGTFAGFIYIYFLSSKMMKINSYLRHIFYKRDYKNRHRKGERSFVMIFSILLHAFNTCLSY